MKLTTIIGARPQIIKAAVVSQALAAAGLVEGIIHTGQHYNHELSGIFVEELGLPESDCNLGIGSGSHGFQTGEMLKGIETVLQSSRPDMVLLYGDTNSTLAGALAAAKLNIPIGHIEAGVRHYDRSVPEETNRVLTDHMSSLLFCPTKRAVSNLSKEGITKNVYWTGDVMYDSVLAHLEIAEEKSAILSELGLLDQEFFLATVHRASNTDNLTSLENIFNALLQIDCPVIVPLHPRTRAALNRLENCDRYLEADGIRIVSPAGYLDFLKLEKHARLILTDSGGVQKEACFLQTPCVTLRTYSPWPETVEDGWNVLVPPETEAILAAVENMSLPSNLEATGAFGNGHAAAAICEILAEWGREVIG